MSFLTSDQSEANRFYVKRFLIKWSPLLVPVVLAVVFLYGLSPVARNVFVLVALVLVLVTVCFSKLRLIIWSPLLSWWRTWSRNCWFYRGWPALMDSTGLTVRVKTSRPQNVQRGGYLVREHKPWIDYRRPRIARIQRDKYGNRTLVVATSSTLVREDWLAVVPRLANAFEVSGIEVTKVTQRDWRRRYLWSLTLIERDGLKVHRRAAGVATAKTQLPESSDPHHALAPWWDSEN